MVTTFWYSRYGVTAAGPQNVKISLSDKVQQLNQTVLEGNWTLGLMEPGATIIQAVQQTELADTRNQVIMQASELAREPSRVEYQLESTFAGKGMIPWPSGRLWIDYEFSIWSPSARLLPKQPLEVVVPVGKAIKKVYQTIVSKATMTSSSYYVRASIQALVENLHLGIDVLARFNCVPAATNQFYGWERCSLSVVALTQQPETIAIEGGGIPDHVEQEDDQDDSSWIKVEADS